MSKKFILLLIISFIFCISSKSFANGGSYDEKDTVIDETQPTVKIEEEPRIGPNPQRLYCVQYWNAYYSREKVDINVTAKGEYDEVVVFQCPDCSLEKHFVEPFLKTDTDGLTGFDRIKACGFVKALFKGSKGVRTIERDVM